MMSHTQLTAISDEEMFDSAPPKPRTSRWRGAGLAVMVVGLVCMVGATWPRKEVIVTPRQRLGQMRDAILEAFTSRSLLEDSSLTTRVEFVLGEEGAEEEPSAMEIVAHITPDDQDSSKDITVELTFNAKADAGADLKVAFDKLLDAYVSSHDDPVEGDKRGKAITLTQDGDSVRVTHTTILPEKEDVKAMVKKMKMVQPELNAEFKFGRDLDTIYEHRNDPILKVCGGLHFTADSKFKGLLIKLINTVLSLHEGVEEHWAEAFTLIAGKLEFRYKQEEELGDLLTKMPTLSQGFREVGDKLKTDIPKDFLKALKEFIPNLNGLETIRVRGGQTSDKFGIDFTNFKPGQLLGAIMETFEGQPGGNGGEGQ